MNSGLQEKLVSPDEAIRLLLAGGVGVLPTDTLYGLVTRAQDPKAVARFYALKNREHKPGTVIAANTRQLLDLGVDSAHMDRVKHLWPNSLSIVMATGDNLFYLHQGLDSLPIRIPKDKNVCALLMRTGPLVTSSANKSGEPSASSVEQAWNYFGNAVDFYVEGGDLSDRVASTIIRIKGAGEITVLREGAVRTSELRNL
jgi:L-threonylcarbamoyladenylate synthase